MNIHRLDESSRLAAATSWGAIAAGVFLALAIQTVLLLLGVALGLSFGDRTVGSGFAWWAFLVELFSLGIGALVAARVSDAGSQLAGMIAGTMTWAVVVAIGRALGGFALAGAGLRLGASGAWAAFFGVLLGLGAALIGGAIGSRHGTLVGRPAVAASP